MMSPVRRAHAAREESLRGDEGSLVMALLVVMMGTLLSALLLPIIVGQIRATQTDQRRVHELHAAQAGLDVALGQIRAANGQLSGLPCGPFTDVVDGVSAERYQVTIDYLIADPVGQTAAWVAANRLKCLPSGTYSAPSYALLSSLGTDQAGAFGTVSTRSLQATYRIRTTNDNIPGGAIHSFHTGSDLDLCMDAGSGSPAIGTNLTMRTCIAGTSPQTWAYNTNLTIVLVSSKKAGSPLGLCLDAGTPHAAGQIVALQSCSATTKPQQQWSINDVANFEGTSDGTNLDNYCLNVQSPNVSGSTVVLGTGGNCRNGYNNVQTFNPDAGVGAGAAGPLSGQLVNFRQFGRCLDVTQFQVTFSYLISWPCKQAPAAANIGWNQRWTSPVITAPATSATGNITVSPSGGGLYCLTSPLSTAAGVYVTVTNCTGADITRTTWKVSGAISGSPTTSYAIIDSQGFCLSPTDPTDKPPDLYPDGQTVSKMVVDVCTGSTLQKWNAPPTLQDVPVRNLIEN